MTALALRSLRHRAPASAATFLTVLLGTALMGSFATLLETSRGAEVSTSDAEALGTMAVVVGAWGTLIVLFSVASTLGITVRQRVAEIGLLRTIGATPRQARRLIGREVLVVATVGALLGALLAAVGGRALLALLTGPLVADDVAYDAGPLSLGVTALVVVGTSLLAAAVAGRRATRAPAAVVIRDSTTETGGMRWYRVLAAVVLIGYGIGMGVVTVTISADSEDPMTAMATSGSASILVAVGLALLAPLLLRWLARPAALLRGPTGQLAASTTSRRSHLLAGVLAPVIVLTATTTGVLMLVGTDGRTIDDFGYVNPEADTINLLNNVVVGMISLFAAIMVVNAFAAVVSHRRTELHRLWLLGATPRQVERSILVEAGIVAAVGVVLGTIAALATVVPFGIARDEGVLPDGQLWLPPLVVLGVVALTLAAARGAVARVAPTAVVR
ncbi:ABC transporter permease [Nocardioides sp. W7]|uniref:FtsX-like permease family protein n=1 Tax=Nocardioides sp. W7 TaxID=2931390 RepID=UPI001FD0CEA0|nr:ABC transporter permease [Nocardioides sp. W7]